jgi:hypothetical protein
MRKVDELTEAIQESHEGICVSRIRLEWMHQVVEVIAEDVLERTTFDHHDDEELE